MQLEAQVRKYLKNNFGKWDRLIKKKKAFERALAKKKNRIVEADRAIKLIDLVKLSMLDQLLKGLELIEGLELIDEEFVLLNTERKGGKQPSADLLAYHPENYCLAIIELKISNVVERQTITELSAYNQGLQNRHRGLSALEVLWIPISTDWRTILVSALEFQMIWNRIITIPLKLSYVQNANLTKVTSLELELFNPLPKIEETDHLSLFSYGCFDAFDYCLMQDIVDKQGFTNYVATICARYKISGFVVYHRPVNLMFPFGFTICIYNPFKGQMHSAVAKFYKEKGQLKKFKSEFNAMDHAGGNYWDILFKSNEEKHWEFRPDQMEGRSLKGDASWGRDFLGVSDFAQNGNGLNIHFIYQDLKEKIDSGGEIKRALGTPLFSGLMEEWTAESIKSVTLFGIHFDLIVNKIRLEHQKGLHAEELFSLTNNFGYLKETFEEFNR